MDLYVGLGALRGRIERYRFDLLELPVSPSLPKNKTLRTFREAKPQLAFSLRLAPTFLEAPQLDEQQIARVNSAAEALGARFVVLPTGPRFRPTTSNRKRLIEAASRLAAEGRRVAWEPRGLWEQEELEVWTEAAGAQIVRDLTRDAASSADVEYTRLLPFGSGARVTQHSLERLALALQDKTAAYVVVVGEGVQGARSRLRQLLDVGAELESQLDDEYDDEFADGEQTDGEQGDDEQESDDE
ncbi:MAG TPA: hypothetical protein VLC09_19685 [Polyangiaceae bacterium]|nr:hypothetical protein [Polyangiaceae bacterium]